MTVLLLQTGTPDTVLTQDGFDLLLQADSGLAAPAFTYATPQTWPRNVAITTLTPANSGGGSTSCSVTAGALPAGLSVAANGNITGTPTTRGSGTFVVTGTNAAGSAASNTVSWTVTDPPVIAYTDPTVNTGDVASITPTNGAGITTTYAVQSGDALATFGLEIAAATGVISGRYSGAGGTKNTVVRATNADGTDDDTVTFTITLTAPSLSWGSPWSVVVDTSPTKTPVNIGGGSTITYEEVAGATNVLADLNALLNSGTGVISFGVGGATPLGTYAVKLKGTNSAGASATYDLTIIVMLDSGGDKGAIQSSAPQRSPLGEPVQRSAVG